MYSHATSTEWNLNSKMRDFCAKPTPFRCLKPGNFCFSYLWFSVSTPLMAQGPKIPSCVEKVLLLPTTPLTAGPLDVSPPVPRGQCGTATRMPHTPGLTKIRRCLGQVLAGFGLPSRARGSWRLSAPPEATTAISAPAPAPCARSMPRHAPARQSETEIW